MEAKIQGLDTTIKGIEKEMGELYAKLKKSKGSSQAMYKNRCVMLLRKKKMYEQQLQTLLSQQFNLDQLAFTKENIQTNIETAQAMKIATQTQQKMMQDIDMDELDDLRDDMEDMMYETNEINEMLNRNYNVEVDEAELDEELKELDNELFKDVLQNQQKNAVPNYLQDAQPNQNQIN